MGCYDRSVGSECLECCGAIGCAEAASPHPLRMAQPFLTFELLVLLFPPGNLPRHVSGQFGQFPLNVPKNLARSYPIDPQPVPNHQLARSSSLSTVTVITAWILPSDET